MTAHAPRVCESRGEMSFPSDGVELTHLLVVADLDASRSFYADVVGATVVRQYGGTSCVLQIRGPGCCW